MKIYLNKILNSVVICITVLLIIGFYDIKKVDSINIYIQLTTLFLFLVVYGCLDVFNNYKILKDYKQLNIMYVKNILIISELFTLLFIVAFYWSNLLPILLGFIGINLISLLIKKYDILIFLLPIIIFPSIGYYSFIFKGITYGLWFSFSLATVLYYYYKKYRKTKIYLNDNY